MSLEDTFREEVDELLIDLEAVMLELEEQPDDCDCVDRAFRAMHTIKGSGSMFGFDKLAAFTHHLENAFDLVRNGELKISKQLISISLDSGDHIRALLVDKESNSELDQYSENLLNRLQLLVPTDSVDVDETQEQSDSGVDLVDSFSAIDARLQTFHIKITPGEDAFASGMDVLPILREIQALGECHIETMVNELPLLEQIDAEKCYLSWKLSLTTDKDENALRDVFIFVEDDWSITIDVADQHESCSESQKQVTSVDGIATSNEATLEQEKIKQENSGYVQQTTQSPSFKKQSDSKENKKQKSSETTANVKVPAKRLDDLMDLVGELVIAQDRLNQSAAELRDPALFSIAEDIERLTTELRSNTLDLRMLPIGTTFARFRRLVRDLSNELGKKIEFVTTGAETELDKTVIDSLGDPLVHLIRNSIDHGIEMPEQRIASGKTETGSVHISAVHRESQVVITIKDDGAGLDADAIHAKAIERGVLTEESTPTNQELYNLIFDAGFSTAKVVSNVSGRGVGMDVVRRSIEKLRGTVSIDSEPGKGSTITIELPLTLAIIEGLLVQVEHEKYVIPLSQVEECIELTTEDVRTANGNRLIEIRGELVPYLRLRECFNNNKSFLDIEQIVVIRNGSTRFGFTVDQVVGQHQTVIKTLGKVYEGVAGLSGATILGDGNVALILDTNALIQTAVSSHDTLH